VKLINLKGKDSIAAVTKVMKDDVAEVIVDDGNIIETETIERVKPVLEVLKTKCLKRMTTRTKPKKMTDDESDEQDDEDES
jgi:DNA gyrase subunit A